MKVTATELRANLYRVLDRVVETGEPVEIARKGRVLRITVEESAPKTFSFANLRPHPEEFVGDLDDIVHMDWSGEWKPFLPEDDE